METDLIKRKGELTKILCCLVAGLLTLWGCGGASDQTNYNSLADAVSPYLQEHADNPVEWLEWSDEALQKAEKEDKLLIISVGYASCHWCHVMEEEAFMDSTAAKLMNDRFVSIKIDREERPDIDKVYSNAAMLLNGSAGWPLNVIALPDGRPLVIGTYMAIDQWMKLLNTAADMYRDQPELLQEQARKIVAGVKDQGMSLSNEAGTDQGALEDYLVFFESITPHFDLFHGGVLEEQKFPRVALWEAIMQYTYLTGNRKAENALKTTLDQLRKGGIYDHVGGGFARYSTDPAWKIPHFEKMLYDNAQLLGLYAKAYRFHPEPTYKNIVRNTADFLIREFRDSSNGYYASLNAVSDGGEGNYYSWTYQELDELLEGKDKEIFMDVFSVKKEGNWTQGKNVLYRDKELKDVANKHGLSEMEAGRRVESSLQTVETNRKKRSRPALDEKMVTAWNALLIKGFLEAFHTLNDKRYLKEALGIAHFINDHLKQRNGELWRIYHPDHGASVEAFLEDYVQWIDACLALYQVSFDVSWLDQARKSTEFVLGHFKDQKSCFFHFSKSNSDELFIEDIPLEDGDLPSANALMASNLYRLGAYFQNEVYHDQALAMLKTALSNKHISPLYKATWWTLQGWETNGLVEVAIIGEHATAKANKLQQSYFPFNLYLGGEKEHLPLLDQKSVAGKTMIYVCRNRTCKFPVENVAQAVEQVAESRAPFVR
ncbi:thioredoxin domain-containing protein [Echinicola sediminis]